MAFINNKSFQIDCHLKKSLMDLENAVALIPDYKVTPVMMSGATARSLLLSYSLGVQPWEAGSVMPRWDRLSVTRITKIRSLVPPSATPIKLGYQIMWLASGTLNKLEVFTLRLGTAECKGAEQVELPTVFR